MQSARISPAEQPTGGAEPPPPLPAPATPVMDPDFIARNQIVERFAKLNPYDLGAVPGSILKIETPGGGGWGKVNRKAQRKPKAH